MGYFDYNETTGQPFWVDDTPPDPSGGAQENDPNYLYLEGYQAPSTPEPQPYTDYLPITPQREPPPQKYSAGPDRIPWNGETVPPAVDMPNPQDSNYWEDLEQSVGYMPYPNPAGWAQYWDPNYLYLRGWEEGPNWIEQQKVPSGTAVEHPWWYAPTERQKGPQGRREGLHEKEKYIWKYAK